MSSINEALRKAAGRPDAAAAAQPGRSWDRPPSGRRSLTLWLVLGLVALLIFIGLRAFRPDSPLTAAVKKTEGLSTEIKPAVRSDPGPDRPSETPAAPTEAKTAALDQPQTKSAPPDVSREDLNQASLPEQTPSAAGGPPEEEPLAENQSPPAEDTVRPQETEPSVREALAAAQAEADQPEESPGETDQPLTARNHFRKARAAQEQGRDSQAVHHYRQALLLDPNLTEAYLNLGNIYFYRHRALEKALEMYTQVLKLDPNHEMAHNNLGVLFLRRGLTDQAETEFYAALQENPGYVDALYNLACLAALKNEAETALDYLARAAALQPETVVWAAGDEDLKSLRRLPRFQKLLQEAQVE